MGDAGARSPTYPGRIDDERHSESVAGHVRYQDHPLSRCTGQYILCQRPHRSNCTSRPFISSKSLLRLTKMQSLCVQEMANPRVRPHLQFLPEDAGGHLSNANQARRWLHEMDPKLLTQMVRHQGRDYFVFEPALLANQKACIPIRWFKRGTETFARAWPLQPMEHHRLGKGWLVHEYQELEVPLSSFAVSFPAFCDTYEQREMPSPQNLFGECSCSDSVHNVNSAHVRYYQRA